MKKWTREEITREAVSYAKTIGMAMLASYVICSKIVTQAQVPTGSMESTVETGSRVLLNRTAYWFWEPQRGDIVAFDLPDDESQVYLKRIIGLPGETICSREGQVFINDQVLEEDYIREVSYLDFGPYTVPEGCYFMMGDNRNNSYDSRYWTHKFVGKDAILGQVGLELSPQLKPLD